MKTTDRRGMVVFVVVLLLVGVLPVGVYLLGGLIPSSTPLGSTGFGFDLANPTVDASQSGACSAVSTCESTSAAISFLGDAVFVFISTNSTATISAVNDNHGNSLSLLSSGTVLTNLKIYVYEEYNLQFSSTFETWVNVSASATYTFTWIAIYGVSSSPVDAIGTPNSGHGTTDSASVTTSVANDLVLLAVDVGAALTITSSGGTTIIRSASVASGQTTGSLYEADASTGSITPAATNSLPKTWVALAFALKLGGTPKAPTSLVVSSDTTTTITWTWTAPQGTLLNMTAYVELVSGGVCSYNTGKNVAVGTTTETVSSLSTGVKRGLVVVGWNSTGQGTPTSCVIGTTASVPAAPTGLAITGTTTTSISSSWTNPTTGGLVNTTMYRYSGSSCAGTVIALSFGTVSSSNDVGGLTIDTEYSFTVSVWNATGESPHSSCVAATTAAIPAAPTGLGTSGITTSAVGLSWTNPGTGGLVNNTVYWYTGSSCSGSVTAISTSGATTSKTITGLSSATEICMIVTAWNSTGQSVDSSSTTATTLPAAPTALSVVGTTTTSVSISWTNPSGTLIDAHVFWQTGTGCASPASIDTGSTSAAYTVTGLTTGTEYCFYVEVSSAGGTGSASSIVTATTAKVPGAPTGLTTGSVTTTSVGLSWSNPSGGGLVNSTEYRGPSGCAYNSFTSIGSSTTSATVTGLSPATIYCFAVQSWNSTGGSTLSNTATIETLPGAPTGMGHSAVSATSITWTWTVPSGTLSDIYLFWEAGASCGSPAMIDIGSVVSTYVLAALSATTQYCAYTEAVTTSGNGAASGTATATTSGGGGSNLPNPPTKLHVIGQSGNSIAIAWTNPTTTFSNITLYWGFVGTCGSRPNTNSFGVHTTSYAVTGLASETGYCFVLQSFNMTTGSNLSAQVIGTTLAPGETSGGESPPVECTTNCQPANASSVPTPFSYLQNRIVVIALVLGLTTAAGIVLAAGVSRYIRRGKLN